MESRFLKGGRAEGRPGATVNLSRCRSACLCVCPWRGGQAVGGPPGQRGGPDGGARTAPTWGAQAGGPRRITHASENLRRANRADEQGDQTCPVWPRTHRPWSCLALSPPRGSVPVWGLALARPFASRRADPHSLAHTPPSLHTWPPLSPDTRAIQTGNPGPQ